ncbi:small G-protein Ras2 [Pelomyxa schiedti]|nr:small G-protein Ras2 [Pelomyxa schiedti]
MDTQSTAPGFVAVVPATSVFGLPLESAVLPGSAIPFLVDNLLSVLSFVIPAPEDLFTLAVTDSSVTALRERWDSWSMSVASGAVAADPNESPIVAEPNSRVLAALLVLYLKSLPHPLIPPKYYWTFEKIAEVGMSGSEVPALSMLRLIVHMLPPTNANIVTRIVEFLCSTGLSPAPLADFFAQFFLRPNLPFESTGSLQCVWVINTMIQNASYVCSTTSQPINSPEISTVQFKLEAIAIYDFEEEGMNLQKGDLVTLLNLHPGDWVEGFAKKDPSKVGYMPLAFLEVVSLPQPDSATVPPLVEETAPTVLPPDDVVPPVDDLVSPPVPPTELSPPLPPADPSPIPPDLLPPPDTTFDEFDLAPEPPPIDVTGPIEPEIYDIPPESSLEEAPDPNTDLEPDIIIIPPSEELPEAESPLSTDTSANVSVAPQAGCADLLALLSEAPSPFDFEANTPLPDDTDEAPSPRNSLDDGIVILDTPDKYGNTQVSSSLPPTQIQPVTPLAPSSTTTLQAQTQSQPTSSPTVAKPSSTGTPTTPAEHSSTGSPVASPAVSSSAGPAASDPKANRKQPKVPMKEEERKAMLTQPSSANAFKVVVIGSGGVGKSAVTISFVQNHFIAEYDPTIEDSYRKQVTVDDTPVVLSIMDTAGQEEYSAMRDQYMRYGDGFLIVFALTTRSSFLDVQRLHQHVIEVKDEPYPTVLVGNKADMVNSYQVTLDEGQKLGEKLGVPYLTVSAKTHTNIIDAFNTLVRVMRKFTPIVHAKPKKQKLGRCSIL